MDLFCSAILLNLVFLLPISQGATFTFVNKCSYTVWPGILSNAGTPTLGTTGFELQSSTSRSFLAPTGWSGRFWGRTGCNFHTSPGICATGDCGSGKPECEGAGAAPPATLVEFTLSSGGAGLDFYDVSLVDGYNLPMLVEPSGSGSSGDATTQCVPTGCLVDVNRLCPNELRVGDGLACKSACLAFDTPRYCCSGAYGTSETCKPTVYSQVFKSVCPRAYSYAYDDASSTFTCNAGADYTITYCPASSPSQKSTTPLVSPVTAPTITPPVTVTPITAPTITPPVTVTPVTTPTATPDVPVSPALTTPPTPDVSSGGYDSQFPYGGGSMNYDAGTGGSGSDGGGEFGSSTGGSATGQDVTPGATTGSSAGSQSAAAAMADGSWVTNMAMGEGSGSNSSREKNPLVLTSLVAGALCLILSLLFLP